MGVAYAAWVTAQALASLLTEVSSRAIRAINDTTWGAWMGLIWWKNQRWSFGERFSHHLPTRVSRSSTPPRNISRASGRVKLRLIMARIFIVLGPLVM